MPLGHYIWSYIKADHLQSRMVTSSLEIPSDLLKKLQEKRGGTEYAEILMVKDMGESRS